MAFSRKPPGRDGFYTGVLPCLRAAASLAAIKKPLLEPTAPKISMQVRGLGVSFVFFWNEALLFSFRHTMVVVGKHFSFVLIVV